MREMVFISHANPEENDFARWLGLQLSSQGYSIWSDVTKLIGGESFWSDIETTIRNQTIKFIFVLSQASLAKKGTKDELALASIVGRQIGLKDFIIPLRVDKVPYGDINIQMVQLNVINFSENWASGLATLLKKLVEDEVPRDAERNNASTIRSWWDANQVGQDIVRREPEELVSNWIPIPALPPVLYLHASNPRKTGKRAGRDEQKPATSNAPVYLIGNTLISFATAQELGIGATSTKTIKTKDVLSGTVSHPTLTSGALQNALVRLLRLAWDKAIADTGLPAHMMANEVMCYYFTTKVVGQREQVKFDSAAGSGRRAFLGTFKGNTWHYGVSGDIRLDDPPRVVLYPHVLASSDGVAIWESKTRLAAARQSACKGWWNPEWRDRQLAFLSWLSGKTGTNHLSLKVSPSIDLQIPLEPAMFRSPVGFSEEAIKGGFEELDDSPDGDLEDGLSRDTEAS